MSVEQQEDEPGELARDGRSACIWCHREFAPAKHNQLYCKPRCRQRSLRMRRRVDGLQELRGQARISPKRLLAAVNARRLSGGLAVLRCESYLEATALLLEAARQVEEWKKRFELRAKRLNALKKTLIHGDPQFLTAADEPTAPERATHAAIVSTDGRLAVAVFAAQPVEKMATEGE